MCVTASEGGALRPMSCKAGPGHPQARCRSAARPASRDADPRRMSDGLMIDELLVRWNLTTDGEPFTTQSSILVPVRRDGVPAMLKIATELEERRGADTMVWWGGEGAARVLCHDGAALLLERAHDGESLEKIVRSGHDDEASRIICAAAARLHAPHRTPRPRSLVPLRIWFADLEPAAVRHGGLLRLAAETARGLLTEPRDVCVLHGDIHHGNILDFGPRGWLAIDPKGLLGERSFDFVNILRNPDDNVATKPGRFARQATVIAEAAGLDRVRLLLWTLAFAGLSAAWILADGDTPELDLAVAELAAAELAALR
jgi:streptomycin 6-kinase